MPCSQVSLEDLDGLQQELEAALSAVVVRLKSSFARLGLAWTWTFF